MTRITSDLCGVIIIHPRHYSKEFLRQFDTDFMQHQRRTGCWVCSKRKVKCDSSAPNPCANCAKRGVECRYEEPGARQAMQVEANGISSRYVTEAGIPRDRAQRACYNCAGQKLKCSGDPNGCRRCVQTELICQYPDVRRGSKRAANSRRESSRLQKTRGQKHGVMNENRGLQSPPVQEEGCPEGSQTRGTSLPHHIRVQNSSPLSNDTLHARDLIKRHVDAYFEYVYPITNHGFLHQGNLLQELDEERAPVVLLKAIAVSTSHLVGAAADTTKHTTQWTDDVDHYIMTNMGCYSVLNLQVLVLWANYHYSSGNFGKAWMLVGLAARLAYCLQINVESTTGSPSEIESRRRMMWNLWVLDRLLAGTVEEFSVCSKSMDSLQLPCNEHFYTAEIDVETDTLQAFGQNEQVRNIGGFAALVGLFDIWREIQLFMKFVGQTVHVDEIQQQVSALHGKLSEFQQCLPSNLKFTNRNLYLHANSAQKLTFVILKSWWHECHCNLYRFSLPGFRESIECTSENESFIKSCRQQVHQSALAQSNFWRSITTARDILVSDQIMIVLVHSNIKTMLAIRKLKELVELDYIDSHWGTTNIPALLQSNISFLDGLASRVPRIAAVQRGFQNIILKDSAHPSVEDIIDAGLPLKRRHSRTELLEQRQGAEQRSKIQSIHLDSTVLATDTADNNACGRSLRKSSMVMPDIDMNTPLSLAGGILVTSRMTRPEVETGPLGLGQDMGWKEKGLENLDYSQSEDYIEAAPWLGMCDDDSIEAMVGYIAPFEIAPECDMLSGTWLAGNGEQNSIDSFWTQF